MIFFLQKKSNTKSHYFFSTTKKQSRIDLSFCCCAREKKETERQRESVVCHQHDLSPRVWIFDGCAGEDEPRRRSEWGGIEGDIDVDNVVVVVNAEKKQRFLPRSSPRRTHQERRARSQGFLLRRRRAQEGCHRKEQVRTRRFFSFSILSFDRETKQSKKKLSNVFPISLFLFF